MSDTPLNFVETNGHRIAVRGYNADKNGPPLVFVHGLLFSVNFWQFFMTEAVQQNHPWYAVSLPGHHPSQLPDGFSADDITPEMFDRVLDGVLQALDLNDPPLLVGHSTGAFMTLNYAARHPDQVRGVISVAGFANGRWRGVGGIMQALARAGWPGHRLFGLMWWLSASSQARFRRTMGLFAHDKQAHFNSDAFDAALDAMYADVQSHDVHLMRWLHKRFRSIKILTSLDTIQAPVLYIAGQRDPVIPLSHSIGMDRITPNSRLERLPGVGHFPFTEDAPRYHQLVTEWLATHSA